MFVDLNLHMVTYLGLEELAEDIDTAADCGWQLRLYSYENKTAGSDVFKVCWNLLCLCLTAGIQGIRQSMIIFVLNTPKYYKINKYNPLEI